MYRLLFMLGLILTSDMLQAAPTATDGNGPLVTNPVGIGNFLQMGVGLLVVVGAILAMAWAIRRMGHVQARVSGAMQVLGGMSLGQRERVVLMQVGEQQILVGIAAGNIRTLLVLDKPISIDNTGQHATDGNFAQKLQAMLKGKQP